MVAVLAKRGQRRGPRQGLEAQARRKSPWLLGSNEVFHAPLYTPNIPLEGERITCLLPSKRLRGKFLTCRFRGLTLTLGVKRHRKSWPSACLGPGTIEPSKEGRSCFWERGSWLSREFRLAEAKLPKARPFLWERTQEGREAGTKIPSLIIFTRSKGSFSLSTA